MNKIHNIVSQLNKIYTTDESFPNCTFMYGQKAVGKSLCVKKFLESSENIQSITIHADECYHNKILFETVVNAFRNHEIKEENYFEPYSKLESMEEFLCELSQLDVEKSYLIVIEKAERLRDMDINILSSLMKLQDLTGLNISCIFITHIALEKFGIGDWDVIKIHVPDFSKNDIMELFLSNYESIQSNVFKKIEHSQLAEEEKQKRFELAGVMNEEFYKNYLNLFLNVFYKACRDFTELNFLSEKCYIHYYAPVLSGEIMHNDVTNLWRNVNKVLKASLNTIYMRVGNLSAMEMRNADIENDEAISEGIVKPNAVKTFAKMLELPYYAKYLLIAGFLASHNDAKSDKKLFMKHHGKERRKNQKPKVKYLKSSNYYNLNDVNLFVGIREA